MPNDHSDQVPLAHSPSNEGMPGDLYARHVKDVRRRALRLAKAMLRHAVNPPPGLLEAIEAAASFHDLGKLDGDIQEVLKKTGKTRLKWDHIDAGVAHLSTENNWMAAWLVRAHHSPGLPQKAEHFDPDGLGRRLRGRRRDEEPMDRHEAQIGRTDSQMEKFLNIHEAEVGTQDVQRRKPVHGLTMRLALSCLVDADHTDSAFYDTGHIPPMAPGPRWGERLEALCDYVRALPSGENDAQRTRNHHRKAFFEACLNSDIKEPLVACEASVGLGKTTAISAYLLSRAKDEGLRRLIIVAPYTNILSQTAERLRRALVLPGENPDHVVAEHHHRADFSSRGDRELAVLWRAPVVLTTAVSFFETLAACDPASLRKLHAVPGSAIFLDEAHAALPTKLWPQNWIWLGELGRKWGCRVVFASGSLSRFWEHEEIIGRPACLPELQPKDQALKVLEDDKKRIHLLQADGGRVLSIPKLIGLVQNEKGPRIVVLNTVQNAAVVAKAMRESGRDVLHLSTALTPHDRTIILRRIERKLQFHDYRDWTLVATSCVEAGVDLSFRCAFRERFGAASTIQISGRVNRHGEYTEYGGGIVYDFALAGMGITQHPGAAVSADVLHGLFCDDTLNLEAPSDVVTLAMKRELKAYGGLPCDQLHKAESERDYPKVKELGRVIDADTRFIVVDPIIKKLLNKRVPVSFKELLQGSIQLWASKIGKLCLEPMHGHKELYTWNDSYDPDFLGIMNGILRNDQFMRDNDAWVI